MFREARTAFRQRYLLVTLFLFVITSRYWIMLIQGETFIPTWVFSHLFPWQSDQKPPWNVLSADGILEFLPWRKVVMESAAKGFLPLVNPYAAALLGGQPLLANGQSGFFYPLHWPYWVMPTSLAPITLLTSIIFHTGILALGTYRLAMRLSAGRIGAVTASIAFTHSATITTWLPLSTHLTVIAWLPWMWLLTLNKSYRSLAAVTALALLAGHVQLAMYSLLSTTILAIFVNWRQLKSIKVILILTIGILIALCQLFPTIEFGQQSHRGGVAASSTGYGAYISNAMPTYHFITWIIPNFFGNPNLNGGSSWLLSSTGVPNNYAEWSLYVSIVVISLFLAGLCTVRSSLIENKTILAITVIGILIAIGSPICAIMYYGIPGFAATGNPARVLPVVTLSIALLAGVSLEKLRLRYTMIGLIFGTGMTLICAILANKTVDRLSLPSDVTRALAGDAIFSQTPILVISLVVIILSIRFRQRFPTLLWLVPIMVFLDLMVWSATYHPTSNVQDTVKTSPGIEYLKKNAKNAPIACIVGNWSLSSSSPKFATLPPNILALHGLHDIAMYDSLILRSDKNTLEKIAGVSLMPPENGNLLRIPSVLIADSLGAQYVVVPGVNEVPAGWITVYSGPDMSILKREEPVTTNLSQRSLATTSLRLGLFITLLVSSIVFITFAPSKSTHYILVP